MAKITPKTLLKKSSKVIDLDDVDISKYNFSIDDLDNEIHIYNKKRPGERDLLGQ